MGSYETNTVQNGSQLDYHKVNCHIKKITEWAKQEPFDKVMQELEDPNSLKTIVFPPASRSKRVRDKEMEEVFNALVTKDLDLPRIGGGFSSGVKNTVLTQLFAGNGVEGESIGSGWHCDMCNNFVVQVQGQKLWTFVEAAYSKYMRPTMQNGKTAISGADRSITTDTIPFLPKQYALLKEGDFLFNPDWLWHSVLNPPNTGFTMGLVSRECHFLRVVKAQPIFTSIILLNHLVAGVTDPEARMRLWSAITGKSLMVNNTAAAPMAPAA